MARIGETLKKARVHKDMTLAQVEEKTKIWVEYLAALEDEEFSRLPGRFYALGFLRNYANCLGLDPKPLLTQLKISFPPEEYDIDRRYGKTFQKHIYWLFDWF